MDDQINRPLGPGPQHPPQALLDPNHSSGLGPRPASLQPLQQALRDLHATHKQVGPIRGRLKSKFGRRLPHHHFTFPWDAATGDPATEALRGD